MNNWFCVHTRPQQEMRAAIELTKQDFRTFLPLIDSKSMFPRYIFVQFDVQTDNWGVIRSTRGCIDLLKNGFQPIVIRQSVIEAIMAYEPPAEPTQADHSYTTDQKVRITNGILAGYEGLFQGTDKQRVQAFLTIMGKKVSVPVKDISAVA